MTKATETVNGTLLHVTRPAEGKALKKTGTEEYYVEAYDLGPDVAYEEVDVPEWMVEQPAEEEIQ